MLTTLCFFSAGSVVSTITSEAGNLGTQITSVGNSVYTVATNDAGSAVSTIAAAATGTDTSEAAAAPRQTQAPLAVAGGILGAGMAVVAML